MARGDAAKKAWALYRAKYGTKSTSRSRAGGGGSAPRRKTRRFLGVLGKGGVTLLVGAPLIGSALQAGERAVNAAKTATIFGALYRGFATFLNGLTKGYGFKEYFGTITVEDKETGGAISMTTAATNIPKNVWWGTTGVGALMFVEDRIVAYLTKAAVKSPIGGFYLTGR